MAIGLAPGATAGLPSSANGMRGRGIHHRGPTTASAMPRGIITTVLLWFGPLPPQPRKTTDTTLLGKPAVAPGVFPPKWTSEPRLIRFEFHGGFRDGDVVTGSLCKQCDDTRTLWTYLYLTDGGRIGKRFRETPADAKNKALEAAEDAMKRKDRQAARKWLEYEGQQTYEVTRREEGPDEILIRLDFVDADVGN